MLNVTIRPVELDDAPVIQALVADPAVIATTNMPWPYPDDGAVQFLTVSVGRRAEGSEYAFAIWLADHLVGICALMAIGGDPRSGELGYWVAKDHWNRGIATRAALQVVAFGFRQLGLARITSSCLERNRASARVLEKAGLRYMTGGTNANPKWGPEDVFSFYSVTREQWEGWTEAHAR
jgi:Acetyltransferases, including N-acetylases of ribosomal proteins